MAWRSGQSYSADLRDRVLAAFDGGGPAKVVASLFRVSVSYIYKTLARRRETGETEARPQRNRQTWKLAHHHEAIRVEVARRARHYAGRATRLAAGDPQGHGQCRPAAQHAGPARLRALKERMARPVGKGDVGGRAGLHQRIRSQGLSPGQDGIRASRAS